MGDHLEAQTPVHEDRTQTRIQPRRDVRAGAKDPDFKYVWAVLWEAHMSLGNSSNVLDILF